MRKIIILALFSLAFATHASDYPQGIDIPIAGLGLSKAEIKNAAEDTLKHFGWNYQSKSDTSITANVRGRHTLDVDFSGDQKLTFKYKKQYSEHKLYRRLRLLRKHATIGLTDCARASAGLDAATNLRRNLVYSLAKSNWVITETSDSKIIAKSIGNGQIEADIASDGSFQMKRLDEIEEEYTDPERDRYIKKIKSVLNQQNMRCGN